MKAKPNIPLDTLGAAPLKGTIGLDVAVLTGFPDIEANVVAPVGPPYPAAPLTEPPVGYAGAGAGLPAARPTLGALLEPTGEFAVVK